MRAALSMTTLLWVNTDSPPSQCGIEVCGYLPVVGIRRIGNGVKGGSGLRHDPDVGKIDLSFLQNTFRCPYMIRYILGGLYPHINNRPRIFERPVFFVGRRSAYQTSASGALDGTISFRQAFSFDQPLDNRSLKLVPLGNLLFCPIRKEQSSRWIILFVGIEFAKWSASVGPLHT